MKNLFLFLFFISMVFGINHAFAQNPIIRDQYTADPTARIFNGKVYVFPSHDIFAVEGKGRPGWFCMEDYHVFSSENLTEWTDHGMIVSQYNVPWVDSTTFSMWAPDCVYKNGKYYFYFPANNKNLVREGRKMFSIGVAIADKPEGPYIPQENPIAGVPGIDPNVFIDKDGQAYLLWAMGKLFIAKLKDNMLELASEPQEIKELPAKGLKEGPFLFERNGIYYMTYPHVENTIERLEYAIGDNPLGPFKYAGVIMDESPMNCWTNHQSFIEYKGQWYLFYHQNALSPKFDKNRAICIDSMFFNADGTIQKVVPTLRGVGLTPAASKIQIDRYSAISPEGISVEFIDTSNRFKGWKTRFNTEKSWLKYNAIDFGGKKSKFVLISASSERGGAVEIRLDHADGPLIATIPIPAGNEGIVKTKILKKYTGIHNIVVVSTGAQPVEIDWIQFAAK